MSEPKNSEQPAFPQDGNSTGHPETLGLTKREYFAIQLMKSSVSYRPNSLYQWLRWALGLEHNCCLAKPHQLAGRAIEDADELLKQLETSEPK